MKANQAAFEVGQLAERMAQGYYAYIVAITVVGRRFVVHADEKLTAFLELESATRACSKLS